MAMNVKDKVLALFGLNVWICEKCGSVIYGKKNCDIHEEKCTGP